MSNDRFLLDQKFNEAKETYQDGLSVGQQFEIFSASLVFKEFDWNYDELVSGITGGSLDGGVDCFYLLINGSLMRTEDDFIELNSGIELRLVLIQSKHEDKVEEAVVDRLSQHIDWILDLDPNIQTLAKHFNSDMLFKMGLFRKAITKYGTKPHKLTIDIHYCCRGGAPTVSCQSLADKLVSKCRSSFSDAECHFYFEGAAKLHRKSIQLPFSSRKLRPTGSLISTDNGCFVILVSFKEYLKFLTERGQILQTLFEFNVRDYEGDKAAVNLGMSETIKDRKDDADFWWFNNGVTILTTKATQQSGFVVLETPKIVNGLQTSNTIYENRQLIEPDEDENRTLLIKVVQTEDIIIQESVIKATNSQTALKPLALKATEYQQRLIEDFLLAKGFYYERRKNFYKNRGKPLNRIIDLTYLGQAMMSIKMMEPDQARARPGTYLKKSENYKKIFPPSVDFNQYSNAVCIAVKVSDFFSLNRHSYDANFRNNLKFHTMMVCGWELAGKRSIKLEKVNLEKLTQAKIAQVLNWVIEEFEKVDGDDKTAKDHVFTKILKSNWTKLTDEVTELVS